MPVKEPRAGQHDELLEPGNDLRMGIRNRDGGHSTKYDRMSADQRKGM
jgi:hypothetical protein